MIVNVDTPTDKSIILSGWRLPYPEDYKERLALDLAGQIIGSRLIQEIREKRRLTYSISAAARPSKSLPESGIFYSYFTAKPKDAEKAEKITKDFMKTFITNGPTQKEMETVIAQMTNILETQQRKPEYWMGLMDGMNYRNTNVEELVNKLEVCKKISAEEVVEVFKKYATEENEYIIISKPQ